MSTRDRMVTRRMPRVLTVATTGIAAIFLVACSAEQSVPQWDAGSVPAGTAVAAVGDKRTGELHEVACSVTQGRTTLAVGSSNSGITAVLNGADGLVVDSVNVRSIEGFSGSYWRDLEGDATASMAGSTFVVEGTAVGSRDDDSSNVRAEIPFSMRIAC
ncbi:hypothetical protein BA059_20685 [Mycolicibacterium sp. (ex Dasyatis americana)]|nr:hypothetical protein BA059_20685 [Mycolicibacterium sp. (ex Dasyatis americana)]